MLFYKITACKDSYFYRTVLVASSEKMWRRPFLANLKLLADLLNILSFTYVLRIWILIIYFFRKVKVTRMNDISYSLMVNVRPFAKIISCIFLPCWCKSSAFAWMFPLNELFFCSDVAFYGAIICCNKISIEQ